MIDKKAALEMAKEAGRLMFFAALSALVAYLSHVLAGLDPNSTVVVIGTFLLRLADKYVHQNANTNVKGLAPF